MNVDVTFSRELLQQTMKAVRAAKIQNLRSAWVWKAGRDHWEFHFGDFFWHGSASNAYDARAHGWSAYLRHIGKEA